MSNRVTKQSTSGPGGGSTTASQQLTGTQVGATVTLNLASLSHTFTSIVQVTRQGQVLTPGSDYTISGNTLTISAGVGADASEIFIVTYTY